jgi:tRNA pseudouridine55 synthase
MKSILNIYKPKGWTSFDVVAKVRKILNVKKVGHAGTLDPLATGVLVVAVGREATKKISEIVGKEKEYIAKIKFGEVSTTDDEEGTKSNYELRIKNYESNSSFNNKNSVERPDKSTIEDIIKKFIGKISQVPPIYSAVKVGGKRAYKLARKGKDVKLRAREVEIKDIKIISYRWPYLKIRVVCGPGTYIRSLARDIGQELGCGAYLAELERTRVGEYGLKEAIKLEDLK